MIRLAIIDHNTNTLFVEDVTEGQLQEYGDEQGYIDAYYSGNISWDYIVDAEYIIPQSPFAIEIDFENLAD